MNKSKAVLYLRVSSQGQEDGYSLDSQERLACEYAKRNNLDIVKSWRGYESAWGKEERKNFSSMIDFVKRNSSVQIIIFDCVDRMTRNQPDAWKIEQLIKEHGKEVHFARTGRVLNRHSKSDDIFVNDIEVLLAKRSSQITSEKTRSGMMEKARQGHWPTIAPVGYLNNRTTKLIEVDAERAPFVKRAFELYATGNYPLRLLETLLYKEGLRTPRSKRPVSTSHIERILKDSIYYGPFQWGEIVYTGFKHTPIISKDLFDAVQKAFKRHNRPTQTKRNLPFTGLIRCGCCGCSITAELKKERYVYYHCANAMCMRANPIRLTQPEVDSQFAGRLEKLQISNDKADWLKEMLTRRVGEEEGYKKAQIDALNRQQGLLNTQLEKMYDDRLKGLITEEFWHKRHNEKQGELLEIRFQLTNSKEFTGDMLASGQKIIELLKSLHSQYVGRNLEEKREFLKILLSNSILKDATLNISIRKPFSILAEGLLCPNWLPG